MVDDVRIAIEAKATAMVTSDHTRGLRAIAEDHPKVARRIVVCLETKRRRTNEGIEILPARAFVEELAAGRIL